MKSLVLPIMILIENKRVMAVYAQYLTTKQHMNHSFESSTSFKKNRFPLLHSFLGHPVLSFSLVLQYEQKDINSIIYLMTINAKESTSSILIDSEV